MLIIPALIAGAAGLAGGLLGNRARRKESSRNREFQERMSSTSWQRGKADMLAAGINPALAYSKGGASSPGGSMASQEDVISPSVSSAMQAKRLSKELDVMTAQATAARQAAKKSFAEAINQEQMNKLWGQGIPGHKGWIPGPTWKLAEANAASAGALARLNQLQIPSAKNLANIAGSSQGENLAWIKYLLNIRRK